MIFALLTLLAALSVAGVAGWFSIVGVMSIYAGAPLHAALVMGVVLEGAKLVTTSWLYRNWDTASWKIKGPLVYFTTALMIATSIGVFGFLTKAHLEQGAATVDNTAKVERIEQQIAQEKSSIADNEKVIGQLDTAINSYLGKDNADRALSVRRGQAPQRKQLRNEIDLAQKRIDVYSEEKFKLTSQVRALQLEVGPIRYIAELFYGTGGDEVTKIESAVKLFTLLIVSTLDPLAVILLIAANHTFLRRQNEIKIEKEAKIDVSGPQAELSVKETSIQEKNINNEHLAVDEKSETHIAPPESPYNVINATVDEEVPLEKIGINEEDEIIIESDKAETTLLHPLWTEIGEVDVQTIDDTLGRLASQDSTIYEEEIIDAEKEIISESDTEEVQEPDVIRIPPGPVEIHSIEIERSDEAITTAPEPPEISEHEDEEMYIESALPDVPVLTAPTSAIISPAITRVSQIVTPTTSQTEQNNAPWAHQESVLRELIGSQPHFVSVPIDNDVLHAPTSVIADSSDLEDKIRAGNTGKYPKALSWVKEFKGD